MEEEGKRTPGLVDVLVPADVQGDEEPVEGEGKAGGQLPPSPPVGSAVSVVN